LRPRCWRAGIAIETPVHAKGCWQQPALNLCLVRHPVAFDFHSIGKIRIAGAIETQGFASCIYNLNDNFPAGEYFVQYLHAVRNFSTGKSRQDSRPSHGIVWNFGGRPNEARIGDDSRSPGDYLRDRPDTEANYSEHFRNSPENLRGCIAQSESPCLLR
jgi:hypothetical protein